MISTTNIFAGLDSTIGSTRGVDQHRANSSRDDYDDSQSVAGTAAFSFAKLIYQQLSAATDKPRRKPKSRQH